jgi:hypothetical protein
MNEQTCSGKDVLCGPEATRGAHFPASEGTFSLRRANYLSKTGKPLLAAGQLTAEQQQELIELVRKGDAGAKRRMIAHFMQLVLDFTRHYANRGPMLLDLVREGNQGLIHALENFEPESGFSFPDYATLCIRQHIKRAIEDWHNSPQPHASMPPVVPHNAPSSMHAVLSSKPIATGDCHGCPA